MTIIAPGAGHSIPHHDHSRRARPQAVIDGVNVDGQVYRIRTQIGEQGSHIEAGYYVEKRDKLTRRARWEQLDEDLVYDASQLDRDVVSESQLRTVIRTFKEKLFTEIFSGRREVPKTLIFAKDDIHAENIVRIVREEFGKGNDFCKKITYRVSGVNPETLISEFRNSYFPRIAVTVDMIATGTDIKPLAVLIFMRQVKSRVLFEQMLGRGTRVISPTDLQAVTSDAPLKDRFVIVDVVGMVEMAKVDTQTLERKRTVPFDKLLEQVALGAHDEDALTSLAGRLARLERTLTPQAAYLIRTHSGGKSLRELAQALLDAIDPDAVDVGAGLAPTQAQPQGGQPQGLPLRDQLIGQAVAPCDSAPLRNALKDAQRRNEQVIDAVSIDVVREAAYSDDATAKAKATVESFQQFIAQHKDEIGALQLIFNQPYGARQLTYAQIKELARQLELPPNVLTTEALWRAYAQLEKDRVRGVGAQRVLTDIISLVRHAVQMDDDLVPYPERVRQRYDDWLAAQSAAGRTFTAEQRWWLDKIAEHVGVNVTIAPEDLDAGEFFNRGGRFGAMRVLGKEWQTLVNELNAALAM